MSEKCICPRCLQPLPSQLRGGVYLPPKKAAIFDAIEQHPGISADGINWHCFEGNGTANAVRVHVHQMNAMLAATKIRIGGYGGYRIWGT